MSTFTTKKLKLMTTSALVLAILFTVAIIASATPWTATDPGYDIEYARSCEGILPDFVEGNTPESWTGYMAFKQDYGEDGFVFTGDEPLRFDFYPDEEDSSIVFSVWLYEDEDGVIYIHHWEATNLVVHYVLVKGGPNYFAYNYDGSLMEDCNLYAPRAGDGENIADISHFTIFYTAVPEETTTENIVVTTESIPEATETTPEVTTTIAETTYETIVVTTESIPEATETTPEMTTTSAETTYETIVVTTQTIPQTGQTGGGQSVLIGLILLGLAGSMGLLMRKVRKNEQ